MCSNSKLTFVRTKLSYLFKFFPVASFYLVVGVVAVGGGGAGGASVGLMTDVTD